MKSFDLGSFEISGDSEFTEESLPDYELQNDQNFDFLKTQNNPQRPDQRNSSSENDHLDFESLKSNMQTLQESFQLHSVYKSAYFKNSLGPNFETDFDNISARKTQKGLFFDDYFQYSGKLLNSQTIEDTFIQKQSPFQRNEHPYLPNETTSIFNKHLQNSLFEVDLFEELEFLKNSLSEKSKDLETMGQTENQRDPFSRWINLEDAIKEDSVHRDKNFLNGKNNKNTNKNRSDTTSHQERKGIMDEY